MGLLALGVKRGCRIGFPSIMALSSSPNLTGQPVLKSLMTGFWVTTAVLWTPPKPVTDPCIKHAWDGIQAVQLKIEEFNWALRYRPRNRFGDGNPTSWIACCSHVRKGSSTLPFEQDRSRTETTDQDRAQPAQCPECNLKIYDTGRAGKTWASFQKKAPLQLLGPSVGIRR